MLSQKRPSLWTTPTKIEGATLLIKEGFVVSAGKNVAIPNGYVTVDLQGRYIYPSFIDPYTSYGMPAVERPRGNFGREQVNSDTEGAYNANEAIKAAFDAGEVFVIDPKTAKQLRKKGFGTVLTFRADGIARGASAMVTLGEDTENKVLINKRVAAHYSLRKGSSTQTFPSSIMGAIALLRQTYMDAAWYHSLQQKPFTDQSLEAWKVLAPLPHIARGGGLEERTGDLIK